VKSPSVIPASVDCPFSPIDPSRKCPPLNALESIEEATLQVTLYGSIVCNKLLWKLIACFVDDGHRSVSSAAYPCVVLLWTVDL